MKSYNELTNFKKGIFSSRPHEPKLKQLLQKPHIRDCYCIHSYCLVQ